MSLVYHFLEHGVLLNTTATVI